MDIKRNHVAARPMLLYAARDQGRVPHELLHCNIRAPTPEGDGQRRTAKVPGGTHEARRAHDVCGHWGKKMNIEAHWSAVAWLYIYNNI